MTAHNTKNTKVLTPKQQERLKNKIKKIKAALAADKRYWGGYYHDGQGLRYLPPELYLQLGDFTGGLRYFNWFHKNFSDDSGTPDFLFEWTVILFKTGRLKEAEKKAFQTFTSNIYLFDAFFDRPITPVDIWEGSGLESADFAMNYFNYSHKQANLCDFAEWLDKVIHSDKFISLTKKYIDIHKQLNYEEDYDKREYLLDQADQLEDKL